MPRNKRTPLRRGSSQPAREGERARAAARSAQRRAQQRPRSAWGSPRVRQKVRQSAERRAQEEEALKREAEEQGVKKLIKEADEGLKWMYIVNGRMGQQEYTNKLKQALDLWQLAIQSFSSGNYKNCIVYLRQVISLAREVDGMYNEYLTELRNNQEEASPGSPFSPISPSPFSPFLGPLVTPQAPPVVLTPGNTQPEQSTYKRNSGGGRRFQSPGSSGATAGGYGDESSARDLSETFRSIPTEGSPSGGSPRRRRRQGSTNLASTFGQPAIW